MIDIVFMLAILAVIVLAVGVDIGAAVSWLRGRWR
jgi:hypothetical protein